MIFSSEQDGQDAAIFHKKCNYRGPTVSLYKIEGGPVFGGYTTAQWQSIRTFKSDGHAVLFNLTDRVLFPILNREKAILCGSNTGPCFGEGDLQIFEKFHGPRNCQVRVNQNSYQILSTNEGLNMLTRGQEVTCTISLLEVWLITYK